MTDDRGDNAVGQHHSQKSGDSVSDVFTDHDEKGA